MDYINALMLTHVPATANRSPDYRPHCLLTFDLECWDEGDWMQPYLDSAVKIVPDSDRAIVERLLELLHIDGHTATFFVTQRFLDRAPDLVRRIHDAGHEIGTHGPRHLRLDAYPEGELRSDLQIFGAQLQALIGAPPRGYRAPHFSLSKQASWLFPLLVEQGYTYDSSQFSAMGAEHGSTHAPISPYSIATIYGPILEIPIPGFPTLNTRLPFAGGLFFRLLPLWAVAYALTHLPNEIRPSLYLHPHELQPDTPRIRRGPPIKRLLKYTGVRYAFGKLVQLTKRFRFASITQTFPSLCKP